MIRLGAVLVLVLLVLGMLTLALGGHTGSIYREVVRWVRCSGRRWRC